MADQSTQVDAIVRLNTLHPSDDPHASRQLKLSRQFDTIEIGRSSKRRSSLLAASSNASYDCPVMSRHHAELKLDCAEKKVLLQDVGSLHGTSLNKIRLPERHPRILKSGDIITFGASVDRGTERFTPYEVEAEIIWQPHQPTGNPVIYRVPDETDIEENSSEEDNGTAYAQKVLKEKMHLPALGSTRLGQIDLTGNDEEPVQISIAREAGCQARPVDLTIADLAAPAEVSDQEPPEEQPATRPVGRATPTIEHQLSSDHSIEVDTALDEGSAYPLGVKTDALMDHVDDDDDSFFASTDDEEYSESESYSDEEDRVLGQQAELDDDDDEEEEEDNDCYDPDESLTLHPEAGPPLRVVQRANLSDDEEDDGDYEPHQSSPRHPEAETPVCLHTKLDQLAPLDATKSAAAPEPATCEAEATGPHELGAADAAHFAGTASYIQRSSGVSPVNSPGISDRGPCTWAPPRFDGPSRTWKSSWGPLSRTSTTAADHGLPRIASLTRDRKSSPSRHETWSVPAPAEALGEKVGKAEYFQAREANRRVLGFPPKAVNHTPTVSGDAHTPVSGESTQKQALSFPHTPSIDTLHGVSSGLVQSGVAFLNAPLPPEPVQEMPSRAKSPILDDTSAYQFEISKKAAAVAAAAAEAETKEPEVIKTDAEQFGIESSPKINVNGGAQKRKAQDISELVPAEEIAQATPASCGISAGVRVEEKNGNTHGITQQPGHVAVPEYTIKTRTDTLRPAKRLRRAAEVFGYAALGGIAVVSALIATAPEL